MHFKQKGKPKPIRALKVNDEVIVKHSSRKDKIKQVLSTPQGTVYRIHGTTFDYDRTELYLPSEFNGTVRPEPEKRRSRYVSGSAQNPDLEILGTEIPEISEVPTQDSENQESANGTKGTDVSNVTDIPNKSTEQHQE